MEKTEKKKSGINCGDECKKKTVKNGGIKREEEEMEECKNSVEQWNKE